MAIEVLERGVIPGDKTYEARCTSCKSLLRFRQDDARYYPDQRDGDSLQVDCPVCRNSVWTLA